MVGIQIEARMRLGERGFELLRHLLVRIVPGREAQRPVGELAQGLEVLVLVPARPHAHDGHRRPALLDHFAGEQNGIVEPADHQQCVGAGRLGLGDFHRQVARRRIVGDRLDDLVRHVELGHHRADTALHRGAEGVVDVHEHRRLRRRADRREHFLLVDKGVAQDHAGGREVTEHELVALLGDRRGGGDVDDVGDALLLGDLRDGRALPGIEGADQKLRALADQLFGARPRDIDVGLGVGVHDLQRRQAEVLQNSGRDIDATLAVLADAGLVAGAWQQHADFKGRPLRAHDVERCGAGQKSGGA